MKKELVVATRNKKKLKEIKDLLIGLNLKIITLADFPRAPRVKENGKTFRENAVKKAVQIARFTRKLSLGEDSGLCVDVLGGAPGIYSSRFSGKDKSDLKNNLKLLKLLSGVPAHKRKAHYVCAVAIADKDGLIGVRQGECSGLIGFSPRGASGFGYDPLFIPIGHKKSFAQLGERIKHKISHRFRALKKAKALLSTYLK